MGVNPFANLLSRMAQKYVVEGATQEEAEKKVDHQIKMMTEQKSAKARRQRKRNKV